jgi:hypothetical protein
LLIDNAALGFSFVEPIVFVLFFDEPSTFEAEEEPWIVGNFCGGGSEASLLIRMLRDTVCPPLRLKSISRTIAVDYP